MYGTMRFDDAIEQYQAVLRRSPKNKEARRALAEAQKQAQKERPKSKKRGT